MSYNDKCDPEILYYRQSTNTKVLFLQSDIQMHDIKDKQKDSIAWQSQDEHNKTWCYKLIGIRMCNACEQIYIRGLLSWSLWQSWASISIGMWCGHFDRSVWISMHKGRSDQLLVGPGKGHVDSYLDLTLNARSSSYI
jgi:hypothetical protein